MLMTFVGPAPGLRSMKPLFSNIFMLPLCAAGAALVAHGGALPADGAVPDGRHGAAAFLPLHAQPVRHRAGQHQARLPRRHARARAVRAPTLGNSIPKTAWSLPVQAVHCI